MTIYRTCSPKRIASPALVKRSLAARIVYIHLLVGDVVGQVPGIVRVGVLGLAEETGLEPADVRDALFELTEHGLVEIDVEARLIRLPGVARDYVRPDTSYRTVDEWIYETSLHAASPLRERHTIELMELRPPRPTSCVYFIQAGAGGPIKIGRTVNLAVRVATLQTGHSEPLVVISTRLGGHAVERELHARLSAWRLTGEWFDPSPEVLAAAEETSDG